ncbi:hypothetical protein DL96DRAFT_1676554 [Flagelloscypha sp. PMI_526]|nr:hypothetical protein DL96DRAFT_1676554 [Flagelloscypha sp. PMI_526]
MNRRLVSKLFWKTSFNRGYASSDHEARISICETGDGSWLLEQAELCRTDQSADMFAPLPLKFETSSLLHILDPGSFPIPEGIPGYAYMYPDRSIILEARSKSFDELVFHLSIPTENNSGIELGRCSLYDSSRGFDRAHYSLCPFAGRLCVISVGEIKNIPIIQKGSLDAFKPLSIVDSFDLKLCGDHPCRGSGAETEARNESESENGERLRVKQRRGMAAVLLLFMGTGLLQEVITHAEPAKEKEEHKSQFGYVYVYVSIGDRSGRATPEDSEFTQYPAPLGLTIRSRGAIPFV